MFEILRHDIQAVFDRDPAARNILEVLTYAGLHAIMWYRIAHYLHKKDVPFFPRDRKSTRLNSSHIPLPRMPSSA